MLIGHRTIIRDLKKLADLGKLSHGYVFFGPSMVGKKRVALGLANYLETGTFDEPRLLQDCLLITPGETGTIGIDEARRLKHFLWQKPALSPRRTVIIDEAEALTAEAQNALLKITEEPPESSLIILVTSDIDALSGTVFSRLQQVYLSLVDKPSVLDWAKERFKQEKDINEAVRRAGGKPGLAAALLTDKKFRAVLEQAERLLDATRVERGVIIKKLLESKNADLHALMDVIILLVSFRFQESKKDAATEQAALWHRLLTLRHAIAYFNLNPRLQLESLFSSYG